MSTNLSQSIEAATGGPRTWDAAQISESDWHLHASNAVAEELLALLEGPDIEQEAGDRLDSPVPKALAALMSEVRQRVLHGHGVVILSGLPVADLDPHQGARLVRRVAYAFGPVIVQDIKNTRFYDVIDTGQTVQYGVRRSKTNVDQELHTDGGWLDNPAEVIALYCLQQASTGGKNRVASLIHAVQRMRVESPALLARLEQRIPWDRQAEHPPGEQTWSDQPVMWFEDGATRLRWYRDYVQNGYKLAGQTMPAPLVEALNCFFEILARPENSIELRLQAGEVVFIHNHACAHARSAFEPGSARHMVRVWHRFDI